MRSIRDRRSTHTPLHSRRQARNEVAGHLKAEQLLSVRTICPDHPCAVDIALFAGQLAGVAHMLRELEVCRWLSKPPGS